MQSSAVARLLLEDPLVIPTALIGSLLAISLFFTPLPLILVICIPLCTYFVTRPYELLLFMVFLIPFNFVFTIGPIPLAAELLKVFAWIPFLLTRNTRASFVTSRFNKWFIVLALLLFLSLFRAHDLPYTLKDSVRFGSNLGLVYLCLNLVDTREKVLQICRVITLSTFVVAVYGFYQWAIQDYGALFWIVNPRLQTDLAHYRDQFWEWRNRIISVLTSEMELGHYFNLCLPIGAMLWITAGRKRLRSKWLLMTVCSFIGLMLTFTFGAWLALGLTSLLFILGFGGRRRWKIFIVSSLVFLLLAGALAIGPLRPVIEAKATGTAIGSLAWDAATRLYGWKLALQIWWTHPLIGAGIGNFEYFSAGYDFVLGAQSQGSTPHETYLYLLANTGLLGLISVLAIVIGAFRSNIRLMKADLETKLIAWALAFAIATNLVGWLSDDSGQVGPHASYLFWLFVGLSEVLARVTSNEVFISAGSSVLITQSGL
jgi:O-antigen ligase